MVSVNYSLIGGNGDVIEFDNESFILNPGMLGFGIPPTEVRIADSAGDGGFWRNTKRGVRDLDLPITVLGDDRDDVQDKLRQLAKLTQDKLGPTILKADYSDETSLTMAVHYVGGAESQWGEDEGLTWCKWVLSFQAPSPFWQSTDIESFSVTSGNTGRGLLPELTKLKLTSSQAVGTVNIDNTGDVAAFPIWRIRGPISNLVISNGLQSFGLAVPVALGETITINTETGIVTDDTGANRYADLLPAPKLFSIPPGESVVTVNGVDADENTIITCSYQLRFEVVH
jgi:hypothetical protein